MMFERASRTFICSVLFLDIVEYSRKPVAEQISLKDRFNGLIASAIREIPPADRIILDTGDGVAINFLGDPEDALFVAMTLRDSFAPDPDQPPEVPARIGINLGPVRLVRDLNGQPNIIGDGINVAQRVMGFAKAGQILVSRSYFEIVSHISEGYTKLFKYEGSRTDKHVREHEIYSVGYSTSEVPLKSPAERARRVANETRNRAASTNATTARLLFQVEKWLGNRSLAYGTSAFSSLAFLLALLTSFLGESPQASDPSPVAAVETTVAGESAIPNSQIAETAPQQGADGALQPQPAAGEQTNEAADESAAQPEKRRFRLSLFKPKAEAEGESDPGSDVQTPSSSAATSASSNPDTAGGSAESTRQLSAESQRKTAAGGRAIVALAIAPWGEVFIDGKRAGVSPPLKEVEVVPGSRVIEIRNGDFPPYKQRVDLKVRQKIKIRYKFN